MLVIALTGGIGSGKTTVSDRLGSLGATIIDTDLIAHQLTAPGGAALKDIRNRFGPGVFLDTGRLDRASLRRIVFSDRVARKGLEAILHPRIRKEVQARLSSAEGPYAVIVVPLLFETGQTDLADRVLVVDLTQAEQIRRVRERSGMEENEIQRILASQVRRTTRLQGADDVIDNNGERAELLDQVDALHQQYLELAAKIAPGRDD